MKLLPVTEVLLRFYFINIELQRPSNKNKNKNGHHRQENQSQFNDILESIYSIFAVNIVIYEI
jgi:hypothetical protein